MNFTEVPKSLLFCFQGFRIHLPLYRGLGVYIPQDLAQVRVQESGSIFRCADNRTQGEKKLDSIERKKMEFSGLIKSPYVESVTLRILPDVNGLKGRLCITGHHMIISSHSGDQGSRMAEVWVSSDYCIIK